MIEQLGLIPAWQNQRSLNDLSLGNEELHLWWLPLTLNQAQKEVAYSLLNKAQLDKYNRRSSPQLQDAYLAGRYHLFTLLGGYNKCEPVDIKLSYSRLNKPSLNSGITTDKTEKIEFNFTDTTVGGKSYGLFVFCLNNDVGVDIEGLDREGDFTKIAKRRFTEQELDYVKDAHGQVNNEKSLAIWTRKEAYGKATGKGINFQMNERNLIGDNSSLHEFMFNDGDQDWRLLQFQPSPQFIACVVHKGHQKLSIKAFNCPYQMP